MSHDQKPVVLLRLPQVMERVALSRSPILDAIKQGRFPAPIKITNRAVAWVESEVDAWVQQRIDARSTSTENSATK